MGRDILIFGSHPFSGEIRSLLSNAEFAVSEVDISELRSCLCETVAPRLLIFCDERYDILNEIIIPELLRMRRETPILIFSNGTKLNAELRYQYPVELIEKFSETDAHGDILARVRQLLVVSRGLNEFREIQKRLKEAYAELSIFRKIDQTVSLNKEYKKILGDILEKITSFIKAEAWSLLLYDTENNKLVFEISKGVVGDEVKKITLDLGQGVAGWVAQNRLPVVVPDVSVDDRFFKGVDQKTRFTTRTLIAVPLIVRGNLIGVVELVNRLDGKPFDEEDLNILQAISSHAAIALETTILNEATKMLSVTDDLTGLHNARFLRHTLERELARAKRKGLKVSFIFMDLDHFKNVNDQYGHLRGRKALKEVAHIIRNEVRDTDIVARYGGDEFVIVLPDTGPEGSFNIAEKIRMKVKDVTFLSEEGLNVKLTASFGIASFPDNARSLTDLITIADNAMFSAKDNNRDTVYTAQTTNTPGIRD